MLHGSVFKVEADLTDYEAYLGWGKQMEMFTDEYWKSVGAKLNSWNPFALNSYTNCYQLTAHVNITLMEFVKDNIIGANQERVDSNATATRPTITRLCKILRDKGLATVANGDELGLYKYSFLVMFITSLFAQNRLRILRSHGCGIIEVVDEADEAADKDNEEPDIPDLVMPLRNAHVGERALRDSVKVTEKTEAQLQDAFERGKAAQSDLPNPDTVQPEMSINVEIGPPIVKCNCSIKTNTPEAEKSSNFRHYAAETKPVRTEEAKTNFQQAISIMTKAIKRDFAKVEGAECTLPAKWTEDARVHARENASDDRLHTNSAFVKSGEIGLDLDKRARQIVTQGQDDAGANAAFISPFEKGFKQCYPEFVTTGLTTGMIDAKMHRFLRAAIMRLNFNSGLRGAKCSMPGQGEPEPEPSPYKNFSVDFSAMDSSWTYEEKLAIVEMVKECSLLLMDKTDIDTVVTHDPRLDNEQRQKIYLEMRHHIINMSVYDATLFSGERGTSIYNRLLVLAICTAELIRTKGVEAAELMWRPQKSPGTSQLYRSTNIDDVPPELNIGNGDDLAQCTNIYADSKAMIDAFKAYGKTITCVCDPTCRKIELLSRFHMLTKNNRVFSLTKIVKNMQRCVMTCTKQPQEVGKVAKMTAKQHAEIATSLYFKALTASQTPGLRWYAYQVAKYRMNIAVSKGFVNTVYDPEMELKRQREITSEQGAVRHLLAYLTEGTSLANVANDAPVESLQSLDDRVRGVLDEVDCSMGIMVEWATFGAPHKPAGARYTAASLEWKAFDEAAREREICADDFANPQNLISDLRLSPWIRKYIGVPTDLVTCDPFGHRSQPSGHGPSGLVQGEKTGVGATVVDNDTAESSGSVAKALGSVPRADSLHHA